MGIPTAGGFILCEYERGPVNWTDAPASSTSPDGFTFGMAIEIHTTPLTALLSNVSLKVPVIRLTAFGKPSYRASPQGPGSDPGEDLNVDQLQILWEPKV